MRPCLKLNWGDHSTPEVGPGRLQQVRKQPDPQTLSPNKANKGTKPEDAMESLPSTDLVFKQHHHRLRQSYQ